MSHPIWGIALFALGIVVIADGVLGFIQRNTGLTRWIYIGLGAVLVLRGLYVWWSFRQQSRD
jgi:threonine/homoserine/homoserine lactone efflux protein